MQRYMTTLFLLAAIGLTLACSRQNDPQEAPETDMSKSDPQAVALVDQLWQAIGMTNWRQTEFITFRWIVGSEGQTRADYRHDWDRLHHKYRVEGTNRDKQHFVALFDTQTRQGDIYLDGEKVTVDSTRTKMLENAYGRYINDSYWLLMPFKLKDPGVILTYDGEKEIEGTTYDVVKVSFENVGLTPGDTYWAYIDRSDHLMKRWEYFLEGWPADKERTATTWDDWQDFNGVKLAMNKAFQGRDTRIYFEDVTLSRTPSEEVFKMTAKTF